MNNFTINKVILWLNNGKKRILEFQADKVNIITGDSNTGKSAILEIIDYCFFASSPKISDSIINENVQWYGLNLLINDKNYTIARKRFDETASQDYYFSSVGEVPADLPHPNNTSKALKPIIEKEFSINNSVTFSYGGNVLKLGSKVSLRYFLMFNTISQDIITESRNIYFDKQDNSRYKEALPRIFDIATGIESIENILLKEKKESLEKELQKIEKKLSKINHHRSLFPEKEDEILKTAREYDLIGSSNKDEAMNELIQIINSKDISKYFYSSERSELEKERNFIKRKINNLKNFNREYAIYKKNLENIQDSLKPIDYLKKEVEIRTEYFFEIVSELEKQFNCIKKTNKTHTPIDKQVDDEISRLTSKLGELNNKLEVLPEQINVKATDAEKLIFLGKATAKIAFYSDPDDGMKQYQGRIQELEQQIDEIPVRDTEKNKLSTVSLIEEIISIFMEEYGEVLGSYSEYKPLFDYNGKFIQLRKPHSARIEPSVGSSSNHMFLHLFFSLAIHEVIFLNKAPYVPPFLIIDQPSRPYFEDNGDRKIIEDIESDNYKIKQAFKLLDEYVANRINNDGHFQMIVFEHISPDFFEDLEHCHLVEEFRNGNALIPKDIMTNQ